MGKISQVYVASLRRSVLRAMPGVVIALVLTAGASPSWGSVLFDQSQTGAQLASNADVTFPAGTSSLSGASLDLAPNAGNQVLLSWSLLDAAPRGDLQLLIEIDHTALTGDADPYFAIGDGTNFLAVAWLDNFGGTARLAHGSYTSTNHSPVAGSQIGTGIGAAAPFSFMLEVPGDGTSAATVSGYTQASFSQTDSLAYAGTLDTSQPISFFLGGADSTEQYRLNAISIQIVPEPSALGLICISSLVLMRRRSHIRWAT